MLAPRKVLWSTPTTVVDKAVQWVPLTSEDKVCDIGCGDGRVILQWAISVSSATRPESLPLSSSATVQKLPSFIGIDIDEERIQEANQLLHQARLEGAISDSVSVEFHRANALEATHLFQDVSVFFLYLIPRGLRIIQPLLMMKEEVRVITYMAPLVGETPVKRELVSVPHHKDAAWPLYLYRLGAKTPTIEN